MSHRFFVVLVAAASAMSACGRENPTAPTPAPVQGRSIVISASDSSVANTGSNASEYPWRRDIHMTVHEVIGREYRVAVTVANQTPFPMVQSEASPRGRIMVGLPEGSVVLPMGGSVSVTSPLLYSEDLRGTTQDLTYTVTLVGVDGETLRFPIRMRIKL
jgi:hypothetical protein